MLLKLIGGGGGPIDLSNKIICVVELFEGVPLVEFMFLV